MLGKLCIVRLLCLLKLAQGGSYFSTKAPSIWSKTYIGVATDTDTSSVDGGYIFTTTTHSSEANVWQNAKNPPITYYLATDAASSSNAISANCILGTGSAKETSMAVSLITDDNLQVLFRDAFTFYQVREWRMLSQEYIAVTPSVAGATNIIYIFAVFDKCVVKVKFKAGINVAAVVGSIADVTINGQTAVIRDVNYRTTVKLESSQDLTGSLITCVRAPVGVISGSVSSSGLNYNMDHMIGTEHFGTEYVVFGLPIPIRSHVCRVVAYTANTDIYKNGVLLTTLVNEYDFFDDVMTSGTFTHISGTFPFMATVTLDSGNAASDMVVLSPVDAANTTDLRFVIPELATDSGLVHALIVIITDDDKDGLLLDGQALPAPPTPPAPFPPFPMWSSVPGTDLVGTYVPLLGLSSTSTHVIKHTNNVAFTAYLAGYELSLTSNTAYCSLLMSGAVDWLNTDHLLMDGLYCARTHGAGDHNLAGHPMEVVNLSIRLGRRTISHDVVHFRAQHVHACQLACFLFENCTSVNYIENTVDANCDLVMSGQSATYKDNDCTTYTFVPYEP